MRGLGDEPAGPGPGFVAVPAALSASPLRASVSPGGRGLGLPPGPREAAAAAPGAHAAAGQPGRGPGGLPSRRSRSDPQFDLGLVRRGYPWSAPLAEEHEHSCCGRGSGELFRGHALPPVAQPRVSAPSLLPQDTEARLAAGPFHPSVAREGQTEH